MHHGVLFSCNNPVEFQLVRIRDSYKSFSPAHWKLGHGGKFYRLQVLCGLQQQPKLVLGF